MPITKMAYETRHDVAMILPLPVSARDEDAVEFFNLEMFSGFFDELDDLFLPTPTRGLEAVAAALAVHRVGSFDASFVPSFGDVSRLNPRFRFPAKAWNALSRKYADYGFVVVVLAQNAQAIHPLAFTFPTAMPNSLFFPTVHVHDGAIHEFAEFDHALFGQLGISESAAQKQHFRAVRDPQRLDSALQEHLSSRGLMSLVEPIRRSKLVGNLVNDDVILCPLIPA